mmetsp:Transcript_39606/g.112321  ORF Transcript_39606/g.112321 Transcript_39606/m.112321 type:complete len:499 (-) Transcript_39606:298-1794(-)
MIPRPLHTLSWIVVVSVSAAALASGRTQYSYPVDSPTLDFHALDAGGIAKPSPANSSRLDIGSNAAGGRGSVTRINADLLIPGRGPPIAKGVVVLQGPKIIFAGPAGSAPPQQASDSVVIVPVAMPGMWDCHTHFQGEGTPGMDLVAGFYPESYVKFASAVKQLKESLFAGITSVRELGGQFSQALGQLISSGAIEGPNFHYAGRCIGMTGGHADEHTVPLEIVRSDAWRGLGTLCDGVPDCLKAVRENLRMRADVIKVMTSGGVLSLYDQVTDDQLSNEEIRAIVSEAGRARRAVAAHAHSSGGIQSAIDNGIFTIEHGTYMSRDQAAQIRDKGLVYVPTCTVTQVFNATDKPAGMSDLSWKKGQAILSVHHQAVKTAVEEGVTILAGTDCPQGCAQLGHELFFLKEYYGMPPLQAIEAATANGPLCLGKLGLAPQSGQLKAGYDADVIALSADPLADIAVLKDPNHVTHVWKAGSLYKSPGREAHGPFNWRLRFER